MREETIFSLRPRYKTIHFVYSITIFTPLLSFLYYDTDGKSNRSAIYLSAILAFYSLMVFWTAFAKTRIRLGNELRREFSFTTLVRNYDCWDWDKIKDLRKTHYGNSDQSSIVFRFNNNAVTLAKNLEDTEAKWLYDAVSEQLGRNVAA